MKERRRDWAANEEREGDGRLRQIAKDAKLIKKMEI